MARSLAVCALLACLAGVWLMLRPGPEPLSWGDWGASERAAELARELPGIETELSAALRRGEITPEIEQCRGVMLAAAADLARCQDRGCAVDVAEALAGQAAPGVE